MNIEQSLWLVCNKNDDIRIFCSRGVHEDEAQIVRNKYSHFFLLLHNLLKWNITNHSLLLVYFVTVFVSFFTFFIRNFSCLTIGDLFKKKIISINENISK